ncbi:uncharacterized protein LOC111071122 [Drosophila obscura]|uniref:uncharacterized protein LOC111071122 n=1 Tax=Drosophila obscura TaxID=7282 RepID=UPI001BB2A09C|nr:uncharacterized protein LOC111071122 [Drosophila obscura]
MNTIRSSTPVLRSRTNGSLISSTCNAQRTRTRSKMLGGRNNNNNNRSNDQRKLATNKRALPETEYPEEVYEDDPLADKPEAEIVDDPPPAKRPLFQLLTDEDPLLPVQSVKSRDSETAEKIYVQHTDAPKDVCIRKINGIKSKPYRPSANQIQIKSLHSKTRSSQRFIWSSEATVRLLQLWEKHLDEFRGKKKNTIIYKEMEHQMRDFGEPSQSEIKGKMDNLSRKYRLEAEKLRATGVRSQWLLFHTIQKLLIGTNAVNVFEDIMFEKNGSSNILSTDLGSDDNEMHSWMDSPASSYKNGRQEEGEIDDHPHEDHLAKNDHKVDPEDLKEDQYERFTSSPEFKSELNMKDSLSGRLLEIEEEKLSIEREKLKVMKAAVRELSAFHRDILQHFKQRYFMVFTFLAGWYFVSLSALITSVMADEMETRKIFINNQQNGAKPKESQREIAQKIKNGEYKLLRKDQRSTVWKVYRVIMGPDGKTLRTSFFCTGCNRVLKSGHGNTSNLRIHKCHVDYMRQLHSGRDARNVLEKHQDSNSYPQLEYTQEELRKRRYRKDNPTRHEWCANGTKMLLQLWATYIEDLRGRRKNCHVHREMAEKMKQFGANATEVKAKMDNLTKKYRKEAKDVKLFGRPSKWEHFYRLQSLLIGTKAVDLSSNFTFNSAASTDDDVHDMDSASENIGEAYAEEDQEDNSQDGLIKEEEEEEDEYVSDNMIEEIEVPSGRPSVEKYAKPDMAEEPELPSERPCLENYEEELDKQNLTIEQTYKAKRKREARLLEIEEEKLAIEREKLKTMKYLKQELSSFHKDMFRLLSQNN